MTAVTTNEDAFANIQVYTGAPAPMSAQQGQVSTEVVGAASDQQRAIAEVQASLLIAQSCPRNELRARDKLLVACQRLRLAEGAVYTYKRGSTEVKGPSIRLAEAAARYYGNIDYGFREVSRRPGESEVEAYCWDKESNTRVSRLFTVKHLRDKGGKSVALSTERDIYEAIASQAQRRVRSAILEIIPGDIIEDALDACDRTLRAAVPDLPRAIKGMVQAFAPMGVNKAMLETRIGRNIEAFQAADIISLRHIYAGMKDGISQASDWFDMSLQDKPKEQPAQEQPAAQAQQAPAPKQEPAEAQPEKKTCTRKPKAETAPVQQLEPQPEPEPIQDAQEVPPMEEPPVEEDEYMPEAPAEERSSAGDEKARARFHQECIARKLSKDAMIGAYWSRWSKCSKTEAMVYMGEDEAIFSTVEAMVIEAPGRYSTD